LARTSTAKSSTTLSTHAWCQQHDRTSHEGICQEWLGVRGAGFA
jgi:hypothetical protein